MVEQFATLFVIHKPFLLIIFITQETYAISVKILQN